MSNLRKGEMPSISVLIPNRNKGPYLSECISSVLDQDCPPCEILIDDYCSTDNSREIISSYASAHPNIKPVFFDQNIPIHVARNGLVDRARGDYVLFLDSDDYLFSSTALSELVEALEENSVPFGRFMLLGDDGNLFLTNPPMESISFSREKNDIPRVMALATLEWGPRCALMRKKYLLNVGGYTRETFEDLDIVIRLLLFGYSFHCIPKVTSIYRSSDPDNRLSHINARIAEKTLRAMEKEYIPLFTKDEREVFRKYPDPVKAVHIRPSFKSWVATKSPFRYIVQRIIKRRHQEE